MFITPNLKPRHTRGNLRGRVTTRVPIVFADTETNGLTMPFLPGGRRIWETALCRREPSGRQSWFEGYTRLADLPFDPHDPDLNKVGLNIGGFYRRHPEIVHGPGRYSNVFPEEYIAEQVWEAFTPLNGSDRHNDKCILIGAVPGFEDLGFGDLLRRHGYIDSEPRWHHHLYDVETAAAARLRIRPGWDVDELTARLGLPPRITPTDDAPSTTYGYDAHTAAADVEWAMDLFDMAHAPLWRIWAARTARKLRRHR